MKPAPKSEAKVELLRAGGGLRLAIPACEPGIGLVIAAPEAEGLIAGVEIEDIRVWADDRGYFLEAARIGQGLTRDFQSSQTQVSATCSYPATIKAFHYHLHQTDCWIPLAGMIQVALVDLRVDSPTFGVKNTMYVGVHRPWRLRIPAGVGHGYKVIGVEPALLVYVTDRFYDPSDEGRIPYNDPRIAYDWEIQHK